MVKVSNPQVTSPLVQKGALSQDGCASAGLLSSLPHSFHHSRRMLSPIVHCHRVLALCMCEVVPFSAAQQLSQREDIPKCMRWPLRKLLPGGEQRCRLARGPCCALWGLHCLRPAFGADATPVQAAMLGEAVQSVVLQSDGAYFVHTCCKSHPGGPAELRVERMNCISSSLQATCLGARGKSSTWTLHCWVWEAIALTCS